MNKTTRIRTIISAVVEGLNLSTMLMQPGGSNPLKSLQEGQIDDEPIQLRKLSHHKHLLLEEH